MKTGLLGVTRIANREIQELIDYSPPIRWVLGPTDWD